MLLPNKVAIKDFFPPSYPTGATIGNTSFSPKLMAFANSPLLNVPPSHTVPNPKDVQYKITFSNVYPSAVKDRSSFSQTAAKK